MILLYRNFICHLLWEPIFLQLSKEYHCLGLFLAVVVVVVGFLSIYVYLLIPIFVTSMYFIVGTVLVARQLSHRLPCSGVHIVV